MFKSTSTQLIVLAVIVGIIAIAWPGVTVLALVILFAVYAFMDAGLQMARAFSSGSAGPVFGHLLLGLVSIAFGVVLFARPGIGAVTLALLFGLFSLIYGISQIVTGAELRRTGQTLHSVLGDAA